MNLWKISVTVKLEIQFCTNSQSSLHLLMIRLILKSKGPRTIGISDQSCLGYGRYVGVKNAGSNTRKKFA